MKTKTSDYVKFPMYTVLNDEITVLFWTIQVTKRGYKINDSGRIEN